MDRDKKTADRVAKILDRINGQKPIDYFSDPLIRRVVASYEVKGSEVFSTSYFTKLHKRSVERGNHTYERRRIKTPARHATRLMSSLSHYGGQVFFVGFHRNEGPHLRRHEKVHVAMVPDVIEKAHEIASSRGTTMKVIFDHHYTDVGDSIGPYGKQTGLVRKSRCDRAREIIISKGFFNHLTEPIFNAKSHYSQGIQAADWICSMLKISFLAHVEHKIALQTFSGLIDQHLLGNVTENSILRTSLGPKIGPWFQSQVALPLEGGADRLG